MFLLLLFSMYWCSISLFTHFHVVNGVVVAHSHPFKSAHNHTESQLETIFFLSFFYTSGETYTESILPQWLVPLAVILFAYVCNLPIRPLQGVRSRAPPVFCL